MATLPFDTHKLVRRLQTAGLTEAEALTVNLQELATKQGLALVREELTRIKSNLQGPIRLVESRLQAGIAEAKVDIVRWMVGFGISRWGY